MRKHHATLGLKHHSDGNTRDARKALFIFFMSPINYRCSRIALNLAGDGC